MGVMAEKPIAALIEKIAKEFEEANADKWTITKIVKELTKDQCLNSKQIKKKALELLQQMNPKAAAVYASFQRMHVRTSRQIVEGFDRGNIIKSLLRETAVPRGVAEKIGREVEEKIKDLEIENISTALIRELVNVKLLEYGHENVRNQYTRVGLPVFEAEKKAAQGPYSSRPIMTEYNLLKAIPAGLAKMHLGNEIYIAAIEDFSTRPVAICLEAEPLESAKETVLQLLEKAHSLERFFSWRPNISGLNTALASDSGKRAAKDAALLFTRVSKAVFLQKKASPSFNTMPLFEPESFSGKKTRKESSTAAALAVLKTGPEQVFENAIAVDTKYKLKLLGKAMPRHFLNCKSREFSLANGTAFEGKGICSFTALNLTGIALNAGSEEEFFEELEEKAAAVEKLDSIKRSILAKRAYIKKQGIQIQELQSAVALDSLSMPAKVVSKAEKEEGLGFAEKTVSRLRKSLPETFVLTELRNASALNRFHCQNRKQAHSIDPYIPEGRLLKKNSQIAKHYSFSAKAESKKELNDLLDSSVRLIEFREA
jgi:hypothetical protein